MSTYNLQALADPASYLKDWSNPAALAKQCGNHVKENCRKYPTGSRTATSFAGSVILHQIVKFIDVFTPMWSRFDVGQGHLV